MKTTQGINRRQWLRAAGLSLAGVFMAPRLVRGATGSVPMNPVLPELATGATEQRAKAVQPRQYLHGFEAYPTV